MHTSPVTGWLTDWLTPHVPHVRRVGVACPPFWSNKIFTNGNTHWANAQIYQSIALSSIIHQFQCRVRVQRTAPSSLLPLRCMLQEESEINAFVLICGTFYLQHLSSKHCEHFKPSVDSWNGLDAMLRKCPHFTWVLGQRGWVSWLVSNRAPLWHGSN